MSLKKIFLCLMFLGVFSFGILFSNTQAKALTIAELQTQIAQLTAQIAALQQQLQQQQGGWCYAFNTNLKIGDTGDDVTALQTGLKNAGFDIGDDTSGTFGEGTASAVVGLQEKYASEVLTPVRLVHGNGFVGKLTRGKLNNLFGCNVDCAQVITYATNPATQECQQFSTPCSVPTGWALCNGTIQCQNLWWHDDSSTTCQQKQFCGAYMYLGLQTFSTEADCKASLNNPTCVQKGASCCVGDNCNSLILDCITGSTPTISGCDANCRVQGTCSTSTSKSITVTSPNGGEQWQVGKTYDITWKYTGSSDANIAIRFYGPSDDSCKNTCTSAGTCTNVFCPQTSGVITYGVPVSQGKYSWTVPSTIHLGDKYKIVIESASPGSLFSPSVSQEVLNDESDNYFSIVSAPTNISSCTDSDGLNYYVKGSITEINQYTDWKPHTASDICTSDASFGNTTGNLAEATCTAYNTGQYIFYTCPNGCKDGVCLPATTQPSITVTSPNGGEQWTFGTPQTITWNSTGINNVNISLILYPSNCPIGSTNCTPPCPMGYGCAAVVVAPVGSPLISNYPSSSGKYSWTIPTTYPVGSTYTIRIEDSNQSSVFDESNNYFNIIAPSTTTFKVGDSCLVDLSNCQETANPINLGKADAWKGKTQLSDKIESGYYLNKSGLVCNVSTIPQTWPVIKENSWWCGDVIVSATSSLNNVQNQLASLASALTQLLEKLKDLAK